MAGDLNVIAAYGYVIDRATIDQVIQMYLDTVDQNRQELYAIWNDLLYDGFDFRVQDECYFFYLPTTSTMVGKHVAVCNTTRKEVFGGATSPFAFRSDILPPPDKRRMLLDAISQQQEYPFFKDVAQCLSENSRFGYWYFGCYV